MQFTQVSLLLAAFGSIANAAAVHNVKRAAALEVTLTPGANPAEVIATVTNTGAQDLNLLTLGTFLDSAPVQKLVVVNEAGTLTS